MRVPTTLLFGLCALADGVFSAPLVPRAEKVCSGLTAQSNNGDRKIALVIDSSGSMMGSDPTDLRLQAGKSILDWLITKDEVTDTKKEDAVTVIDFSDSAQLDYKLGPPDGAYAPLANISILGGTYIADGVRMGISQLTASGTGNTKDRSGIIVFTDGEDSSVQELVDQINTAKDDGIRVSFGYLGASSGSQDPDVLRAIMNSGGRYYGIYNALSSRNFINALLVNGLTKQDNPKEDRSILLSGLEGAQYIAGTETQTMSYGARSKEQLKFTVTSVDAGTLDAQVVSGKKTLASQKSVGRYGTTLSVVAPGDGNIDVKVTAHGAAAESIFLVGVTSNLPAENCTVGIGDNPGKSNKAKIIGPAVAIPLLAIMGGGSYFLWKHFHKPTTPGGPNGGGPSGGGPDAHPDLPEKAPGYSVSAVPPPAKPTSNWLKDMFKFPEHGAPPPPPPPPPPNNKQTGDRGNDDGKQTGDEPGSEYDDVEVEDESPQDLNNPTDEGHNKRHTRLHRMRIYGNNHHHHVGPEHPCYNEKCSLNKSDHICDDAQHPCTCVDPKCKLNSRLHFCSDNNAPNHKCPGPKENPYCPLNDPAYMEAKKKEHNEYVRTYMAQDAAKAGVKMAANYGIRALAL